MAKNQTPQKSTSIRRQRVSQETYVPRRDTVQAAQKAVEAAREAGRGSKKEWVKSHSYVFLFALTVGVFSFMAGWHVCIEAMADARQHAISIETVQRLEK